MNSLKKFLLSIPIFLLLLIITPINSYADYPREEDYDEISCCNIPFSFKITSFYDETCTLTIPELPDADIQLVSSSSETDSDGDTIYRKYYRLTIGTPGEYTLLVTEPSTKRTVPYTIRIYEHNFSSDWTTDKEATCTAAGSRSHHCIYCNSKVSSETIPATGHASDGWKVVTPASCSKTGKKTVTCSKCNEILATETLPTTAHTFSSWKTSKKATIFKAGQKKRTCVVCSKSETKKLSKLKATVKLKKSKITVNVGNSVSLKIKSKTKGDSVSSWSSSNKKVVTVNRKSGKIKGIKKGRAYVTLKMKSGCTAKCKVTVK